MPAANQEAQSSCDAPPLRQGALDAADIRRECPRFRILIIGKANAGKTTILRKVCNAKPDTKPDIYDAEGKKIIHKARQVRQEPKVCSHKLTHNLVIMSVTVLTAQVSATEEGKFYRCPKPFY